MQVAAVPNWKAITRLEWFTVVWMTVEVAIAFIAAVRSGSVALAAFGGDSAIEPFSAATILWRFHSIHERARGLR
jgi:hypothetical protein